MKDIENTPNLSKRGNTGIFKQKYDFSSLALCDYINLTNSRINALILLIQVEFEANYTWQLRSWV